MSTDLYELVSGCLQSAQLCAQVIRQVFSSGDLHAKDKAQSSDHTVSDLASIEDPQTIADVKGQQAIVGCLSKWFPEVKLVGEEGHLEGQKISDELLQLDTLKLGEFKDRFPEDSRNLETKDLIVWIGKGFFISFNVFG